MNKIDLPQADPTAPRASSASSSASRPSASSESRRRPARGCRRSSTPSSSGFPRPPATRPRLRALVFDSSYDQYRGVVAFVRVVDGHFETREPLRAMAQGTSFEAEELGVMSPAREPVASLGAGEVGYVVTGLKDVSRLRVGDTLTSRRRPAVEPLPGYQDVKPMVFAGIFPTDSDDYPEPGTRSSG